MIKEYSNSEWATIDRYANRKGCLGLKCDNCLFFPGTYGGFCTLVSEKEWMESQPTLLYMLVKMRCQKLLVEKLILEE